MNTTTKLTRILVPTDFSDTANHALRYASELARASGASLTVLYADPFTPPIDFTATVGGWDEHSFEQLKARAEEELLEDAALHVEADVPYDTVVRVDSPLAGILAQARESGASLIVMGTHGRTGVRRLVLGSVTEAVMRQATLPVLAVPPRAETLALQTIVCPVDYTAECYAAVQFAARLAPPTARFYVVRAAATEDLAQSADDFFEMRAWVPASIATRCELKMLGAGHVAESIDALARELRADLIVTTEHAGRKAADVLHGTFAARVLQHSDCPVLTLNAPAAAVTARAALQEERTARIWANP